MAVEESIVKKSRRAAWTPKPSLPGTAYHSPETYELEQQNLFHDNWYCVGRSEQIPNPGDFLTADVANESVFLTRTKAGEIRGFYNVCRHRGTRLCDDTGHLKSNVIKCPYHAWTYDLEGRLLATPNVHEEEGFDKSDYSLWPVSIGEWDGYLFVSLSADPRPLDEWLRNDPSGATDYERYGVGELRVGATLVHEVAANWKIVIDNYNECLHCPNIHPELVKIVPIYRKGDHEEREDWAGVTIAGDDSGASFTLSGKSSLPRLPGISDTDAKSYYGYHLFPNLLMNLLSDCVVGNRLEPRGPEHTTVITEFMFRPETIGQDGFDPGEIVEFVDLVLKQDWEVCARAQKGVRSRAFDRGGVYPYNDRLVYEFNQYYLKMMG